MDSIHPSDRSHAIDCLVREEADVEFLPYIDKINQFKFCVTGQSCIGHIEYALEAREALKLDAERTHWGYLWLWLTEECAFWLNHRASQWDWLESNLSQYWSENASEPPKVTPNGSFELVFAWDSAAWPQPAEDILSAIQEFDTEIRNRP